jgi:hypothetical protein
MNITISQISNGWVVAIAHPKGNSAIYCVDYDKVLEELSTLNEKPDNVTPISN